MAHRATIFHAHLALGHQPERHRIGAVLDGQHPRCKAFGCIAGENRHHCLREDRAFVHAFGHEVHRAAGDLHAGVDRPLMGVQAGEERQQRGVDVEDPPLMALDEGCRKQPHIAGQADDIRR
ncbi:hypothetical protein D9M70_521180 [compost metagenome]